MDGVSLFEFEALAASANDLPAGVHGVPAHVFEWLEAQCLRSSADAQSPWARLGQRRGKRVVQVGSFVGVIQAPGGFQIEVLPKVGKVVDGGAVQARKLLVSMLMCLREFRHMQSERAQLDAVRMPLFEVFVADFLQSVSDVIKHGLRGDYAAREGNVFALKGKLLVGQHLRQNLCRADRLFVSYDEFSADRAENRLLHSALRRVLSWSRSQANQRFARELAFAFAEVPPSATPRLDFQRVRIDRGMDFYPRALAWASLILDNQSPLTGKGTEEAPSLLFPMEAVFEAFVAKHLGRQLCAPLSLHAQVRQNHLVRHQEKDWFRLRPDLLVREHERNVLVLDTKWKLLDQMAASGSEKYGLSQADLYQLQAYGLSYLDGEGEVLLVYPRTDDFDGPLPVFEFPNVKGLRLWVVPFCLKTRKVLWPADADFVEHYPAMLGASATPAQAFN